EQAEDEGSEYSLWDAADVQDALEEDKPCQEQDKPDTHRVRSRRAQARRRVDDALQPHPEPNPTRGYQCPGVGPGTEEVPEVLGQEHDAGHADDDARDAK